MNPPLLGLGAALVEIPGEPPAGPLTLDIVGPRAVIIGEAEPLLGPLLRRARVASGRFDLLGTPLDEVDPKKIGLVPLDPPLPLRLTPADYVAWGARLAGAPERAATDAARALCALVGLGALADRPIEALHVAYRRLTALAQALVTHPELLVIEAPLSGLDHEAASYTLIALGRACEGRSSLISLASPEPGSPAARLAEGADERVELSAPEIPG